MSLGPRIAAIRHTVRKTEPTDCVGWIEYLAVLGVSLQSTQSQVSRLALAIWSGRLAAYLCKPPAAAAAAVQRLGAMQCSNASASQGLVTRDQVTRDQVTCDL